LIICSYIDRL